MHNHLINYWQTFYYLCHIYVSAGSAPVPGAVMKHPASRDVRGINLNVS